VQLQAANREKRQPKLVTIHPSQLTGGVMHNHGSDASGKRAMASRAEAATADGGDSDSERHSVLSFRESAMASVSAKEPVKRVPQRSEERRLKKTEEGNEEDNDEDGDVLAPILNTSDGFADAGHRRDEHKHAGSRPSSHGHSSHIAGGGSSLGLGSAMGFPSIPTMLINGGSTMTPSMLYGSQMGGSHMVASQLWQSQFSTMAGGLTVMVPKTAKDKLSRALDSMVTASPPAPFADGYQLLMDRVSGRQALINFAVATDGSCFQYAIKCDLLLPSHLSIADSASHLSDLGTSCTYVNDP
jgi:hypothetical protein